MRGDARLHIAHVIYRLDVGGMENGLVNLVNRMPRDKFRHSILVLTCASSFRERIVNDEVDIVEFHKPDGNHLPTFHRIRRTLRELRPNIVHTRNLGTLDISPISKLAGCKIHVHGEHGWHAKDLQGRSARHRVVRKFCDPFVQKYVAVSRDIAAWLSATVGINPAKIETIHNGVDLSYFGGGGTQPRTNSSDTDSVVFGTIGRQDPIKGLDVFIDAIALVLKQEPDMRSMIRVIMAGDGPEHGRCVARCTALGLGEVIRLPGTVENVPSLLRDFDFFVQPSLNEGMSNTILEAMASGLPVVATDVGGNPELIRDTVDGSLVPPGDVPSLADRIICYARDAGLRETQGISAQQRAANEFSLDAMTQNYGEFYQRLVP
ncbi:MAG TPA: TIGR03088 family PEP-CTERM/XrtA system glycosyltransferase [Woeseiaceae bacterium]|nr:TIGR03088 family PEP-CTERM/XrtA system glycosyltransferase [Woeseiaceae bacterium]